MMVIMAIMMVKRMMIMRSLMTLVMMTMLMTMTMTLTTLLMTMTTMTMLQKCTQRKHPSVCEECSDPDVASGGRLRRRDRAPRKNRAATRKTSPR